ncbi:hypothetical protein Nmel_006822 [Mimus melanotis]
MAAVEPVSAAVPPPARLSFAFLPPHPYPFPPRRGAAPPAVTSEGAAGARWGGRVSRQASRRRLAREAGEERTLAGAGAGEGAAAGAVAMPAPPSGHGGCGSGRPGESGARGPAAPIVWRPARGPGGRPAHVARWGWPCWFPPPRRAGQRGAAPPAAGKGRVPGTMGPRGEAPR